MRRSGVFAAVIAAGIAVIGCSDVTGDGGTGRLLINLTDAPGDLQEAFVKIDRIILIPRDGEDAEEAAGRIEFEPDVSGYINLLTLTGGQVLELADESGIPEGTYSQLRLVIDEAYIRLDDDRVFATAGAELPAGVTADGTLKCPSCSSSGFKVKFVNGGMTVNTTPMVTIDFDAGQSFGHEAGQSGQWIMHPVLRATSTNIPFGFITGNVALATGVTLPQCGGQATTVQAFQPVAVLVPDTLSGVVDAAGAYKITTLAAGTYTVDYIKDVTFTNGDSLTFAATATPPSVTQTVGGNVTSSYQITAATCH